MMKTKHAASDWVEILTADDLLREDGEYARVEIVYDKVRIGTWIK